MSQRGRANEEIATNLPNLDEDGDGEQSGDEDSPIPLSQNTTPSKSPSKTPILELKTPILDLTPKKKADSQTGATAKVVRKVSSPFLTLS